MDSLELLWARLSSSGLTLALMGSLELMWARLSSSGLTLALMGSLSYVKFELIFILNPA